MIPIHCGSRGICYATQRYSYYSPLSRHDIFLLLLVPRKKVSFFVDLDMLCGRCMRTGKCMLRDDGSSSPGTWRVVRADARNAYCVRMGGLWELAWICLVLLTRD